MDTKKDSSYYKKQLEDTQSDLHSSMAKLTQLEENIRRLNAEKGQCRGLGIRISYTT